MAKTMCVIPARAGSKGIPGKNVKVFDGEPLFIWSVIAALRSKLTDLVVVSSNCPKTKRIFDEFRNTHFGARVYWLDRPEELCADLSSTESCLIHASNHFDDAFDYIVTLQATSPLRKEGMVDDALKKLFDSGKKSLVSVSSHTPFFMQPDGEAVKWYFDPLKRKMRQQYSENELFYHDDGNIYVTAKDVLLSRNCRLDENPYLYINDPICSLQVDSELDWLVMETIKKSNHASELYI